MSISASRFSPKITVQASEYKKAAEGVRINLRTDSAISLEGLPGIDKKITIQATHLNPDIEEKIKTDRYFL